MKALTDGAQVRFFIRDAKTDNLFIMREGFDLSDESTKNQSAAAYSRVIKKAGRWSKVSASFDFSKTVNAFASIKGVESKGGTVTELLYLTLPWAILSSSSSSRQRLQSID